MGGDFCGFGPVHALLIQVLFDLLSAWAAGVQIFLGVALDLRCSVRALVNLISQLSQPQRQFGSIDRSRILLRTIQLVRLQRVGLAVRHSRDVEDDNMRVKLRCGIAVHRTAAVMLKLRGNPFAGCLCWMVSADAGLNIFLQFVESDVNGLPMGFTYPLVSANQGRQRDTLGRAERRVPTSPVFHRANGIALTVHVLIRCPLPNEGFPSERMLPVGESCEVVLLHFAFQAPLCRHPAVPFASDLLALGVVVVLGVREFPLVVGMRLSGAERLGDRQHWAGPGSRCALRSKFFRIRSSNRRGTVNLPLWLA